MQCRIGKWGNSLAVRIPSEAARMAGLAEGDEVAIHAEDGRIVLRRTVRRYALEELIEGISAENRHDEKTWGGPAGAEAW